MNEEQSTTPVDGLRAQLTCAALTGLCSAVNQAFMHPKMFELLAANAVMLADFTLHNLNKNEDKKLD